MNADKNVAVGVEIGGGRATIALVDGRGQIRHRLYEKTLRGRPATATLQPYLRGIDTVLAHARTEGLRVRGIGVSIPGSLDQAARRPFQIPTLPSLNGFPLSDLLEARYDLPARLHVDVDAALLGESLFGAGRGYSRLLFITVNAVVGAALVVDGELERSQEQYIGHVCHMLVSAGGPRCSCGKRGCINTLISMEALLKMVQRAIRRGQQTGLIDRLSKRECFSSRLLAEEASRGDSVALWIYSEVSRWLGTAAGKYIGIFAPDVLILGGGVFDAGELLLSQVRAVFAAQSQAPGTVGIVPAHLGSDASLVGTAVPLLSKSISQGSARPARVVNGATGEKGQSEAVSQRRQSARQWPGKGSGHRVTGDSVPLVAETSFPLYPYPDVAGGNGADAGERGDGPRPDWFADSWLSRQQRSDTSGR